MKFGIKLPYDIFCNEKSKASHLLCEAFGNADTLLDFLSKQIDVIELGVVEHTVNPLILKEAASICKRYGLSVTIHGSMSDINTADEFFAPYTMLFSSGMQALYNITVHPFSNPESTKALLSSICKYIDEMNYPVRITLENQRFTNENFRHTLCRDVADIVKSINHPKLYTCFDFGHQLSNVRKNGVAFDIADDAFFSVVRHTHIHSFFEGVTHFPLSCGETALEYNLTKLMQHKYDGALLLELAPARYCDRFDIKASILSSISILKSAAYQVERKIMAVEEYESRYVYHMNNVNRSLQKIRCGLGVLSPAMYILKMGNTKLAVDPSLWDLPVDNEGRNSLMKILRECDAVIVTHTHGDHFDCDILDNLSIPCFIPDFISYNRNNLTFTNDGYEATVGDVHLTFFESAHSLSDSIVPEYGFCIDFDGKNYVFPADVRDYNKLHRVFPDTEAVILHLWLGRANALNLHDNEYLEAFCRFAKSFGAKKVYLSHMFDIRREIEDMWSEIHSEPVRKRINNCNIIKCGDLIEL